MVKLTGALKHPGLLLLPITVIVAETGVIPLFIAVNEGNNPAPVPLAGSPMAGLLLVQVNEEEPINIFCMILPLQTVTSLMGSMTGAGSTMMLKFLIPPRQPLASALATRLPFPLPVVTKEGIFP